jgi:hypothetical protein
VWLSGCTKSSWHRDSSSTLSAAMLNQHGASLSILGFNDAGTSYVDFTLSCDQVSGGTGPRLLLRDADGCFVHPQSYAIHNRASFFYTTLPPSPPPPSPPPAPPPLVNCTLDHLRPSGANTFNYTLDQPDGTLHAEVAASFEVRFDLSCSPCCVLCSSPETMRALRSSCPEVDWLRAVWLAPSLLHTAWLHSLIVVRCLLSLLTYTCDRLAVYAPE